MPILLLSPMIQGLLGLKEYLSFPGNLYILFTLASMVIFYGGYPILKGLFDDLQSKTPGMMTLIAVAITTAYLTAVSWYSDSAVKFSFGSWAKLINIMLLDHCIQMKSVLGASKTLEELIRLMPSDAHKLMPDGNIKDVRLSELVGGEKVLAKPGEKIPADSTVVDVSTRINDY